MDAHLRACGSEGKFFGEIDSELSTRHFRKSRYLRLMQAVEFTAELSGSLNLLIPKDVAEKLPKTGRARIIVLPENSEEDADWQTGAYQQFLRDDEAEDAIYDTLA
jgi:hypothetical protein